MLISVILAWYHQEKTKKIKKKSSEMNFVLIIMLAPEKLNYHATEPSCELTPKCKAGNTFVPRQAAHRTKQPQHATML